MSFSRAVKESNFRVNGVAFFDLPSFLSGFWPGEVQIYILGYNELQYRALPQRWYTLHKVYASRKLQAETYHRNILMLVIIVHLDQYLAVVFFV